MSDDARTAALRRCVETVEHLLASAYPHPVEHPTMARAWAAARPVLEVARAALAEPVRTDLRALLRRAESLLDDAQSSGWIDEAIRAGEYADVDKWQADACALIDDLEPLKLGDVDPSEPVRTYEDGVREERARVVALARSTAESVRGSGEAQDRYADALVMFAFGLEASE